MPDAVLTETRGRVLLITLNRPEAKNAINNALAQGLLAAVARLDADDELTAGVVTGAGGTFCSGMDLKAFATEGPPQGLGTFYEHGTRKPLIAAVEGHCVAGGLEMALSCDLIVAAADAKLGIPEAKVGLFAAGGALFRLPNRIPYAVGLEMALTGDPITAERAYAFGLVSRLAEPGQTVDAAMELGTRIAKNAPLAIAASKEIMRATRGMTESEARAFQLERRPAVFTSNDAKEGPRAFAEKRPPNWSGT